MKSHKSEKTSQSQKHINIVASAALIMLLLIVVTIIIFSFPLRKKSSTDDGISNYSGTEALIAREALNFGRGNIGPALSPPHIHIAQVEKTTTGNCNTEVTTGEGSNRYKVEIEEVGDSGFVLKAYSIHICTH